MTFTSSSWGGRYAVGRVISQFIMHGRGMLPVCSLESKARGDANGNWNPVFKILTWVPKGRFSLEGEILPQISAKPEVAPVKMTTAEFIEDELPF